MYISLIIWIETIPFYDMKRINMFLLVVQLTSLISAQTFILVDHTCTNFHKIPVTYVNAARSGLHIAYGHTSHGSQLVQGMTGILGKYGLTYDFNNGGLNGALDLRNYFIDGTPGNPDRVTWASLTRKYLNDPSNSDINVVIWAWCGEVKTSSQSDIDIYLNLMNQLELDYPAVKFVYMTDHLDGSGVNGNLNVRNEQIRTYCNINNKILFDFADIESYDPQGLVNYMVLMANDYCDYDSDKNGTLDANWATLWSNANPDSCFYTGDCAHSPALNCQQKGIAAWWLWAMLAGWNGGSATIPVANITVSGVGGATTISTDDGTLQLSAAVLPDNATNKAVTWSITNGTGQATINSSGLVTAVANGTVTVKSTANDGSFVSGTLVITISNQNILVTNITVDGANGITSIDSKEGTLQLIATVLPEYASNKTVTWSIIDGTGQATINSSGLLTAVADGTVTVKATANDGSEVNGELEVIIQNQDSPTTINGIDTEYFKFLMNKSEIQIQLPTHKSFHQVRLYDMIGNLLLTENVVSNICIIDISSMLQGIYIVRFSTKEGRTEEIKVFKW